MADANDKAQQVKVEGTYKLTRNENLDEYFRIVGKVQKKYLLFCNESSG